jgi:hypothetical protein
MQNANDDEREELLNKFKNIKEAYEVLSDNEKRKLYDAGNVKPPPGGWYVDLDPKILANLQTRVGAAVGIRGRGIFRGGIITQANIMRGTNPRGMPMRGHPIIRGKDLSAYCDLQKGCMFSSESHIPVLNPGRPCNADHFLLNGALLPMFPSYLPVSPSCFLSLICNLSAPLFFSNLFDIFPLIWRQTVFNPHSQHI